MNRTCVRVLACTVTGILTAACSAHDVDFASEIQPLLKQHCWSCHGEDKQESGLRLDRRDALLLGGDLGKVVVPGNSAESRLIQLVSSNDPDSLMPPKGERLTNQSIELLKTWIDQGCVWPDSVSTAEQKNAHWAYQPLNPGTVPDGIDLDWPKNPIDAYVLKRLSESGLRPSPEADRYTLIRRLSLDLIGLPPSVSEVDQFVQNSDPGAYEELVDRLLASPHFGERWGRHWLDMARYADSDGYEKDNARPDAYRWRDWVIDAINSDMPFDQFTIQQLAGDLLPDATAMERLATAFHRQTLTNTEGGTDQEQFRVEACFDRTETTGSVWLGLTVGCARCHSHKYDAISQREYYQLFAVFNNGDEQTTVVPKSAGEIAAYTTAKAAYDKRMADLTDQIGSAQKELEHDFDTWDRSLSAMVADASSKTPDRYPLLDVQYSSDADVAFATLEDGSVRVNGPNPDRVLYIISGQLKGTDTAPRHVTALRLEVLQHRDLPSNGPGRVAHGNFVLSELTAEVAAMPDFSDAQPLKLVNARADFEQSDRPWLAKNVIDGNPETGWAIGPQYGKPHWLVVGLQQPISVTTPLYLRVRLNHQYGSQHSIGRFRLLLQSGFEPGVTIPENIFSSLMVAAAARNDEQKKSLFDYFISQHRTTQPLLAQLEQLRKEEPPKPELTVRVLTQRQSAPRQTFVLKRGEFLDPVVEMEITSGGLSTLPSMTARNPDAMPDRLDLARWLVSPTNPLTPRVTANHVWRILFGHGLVRTPADFGVRGERPTHPELLDWLAKSLIEPGSAGEQAWSRKALIKRIVMSATYRQSSQNRPDLQESDPQNLLLARQNRVRVEGEIVRDIGLEVAGLLSRKIGGPSVFPPLPPGIADLSYAGNFQWKESSGEDRHRRGMYTFFKRTSPHPSLTTFDCPDANLTCVSRQISNTPLQALISLNNETSVETSRAFASRLLSMSNLSDQRRLTEAFRICVARQPLELELHELERLLAESRAWYAANADQADLLAAPQTQPPTQITPQPQPTATEQAAWIAVARILLNLDELITRE